MIPVKEKSDIISKFRIHETDTGSSDVQIAVLSEEIGRLASHLENHPKDNHSRRGLLKMVAQRKKLLSFLSRENEDRYQVVIKKLGLKK
ncbi:MAG: 30S ribosomal protein S15 [Candidatus Ryanbacteria bacterium RIFCSPHIGHO2_02_FULL_45_13b]|uniref:Small ribosomal subunit protein uS15 n=1 Tax=Candidatus Ryanbacteria bacterium RIFCSPHIGHO2_02_FULL_45_13b TaxID=1802117 RepID=A0A1G2G4Z0_9BACT|nr:MAG: 30S ribosomal protein S15 [Candidatus Ryanbacteria bacterium RIFCSPHIGHO2_02_FULL_45_13b]